MQRYRWPILFFTAVAFWNLVGAGLFGFLINPPLPLYYMQGLNLTPLHGHTALFGVYGFLGLGLMLFCLRGLKPNVTWNEATLRTSFWALNIGLAGMALLTLLPIGVIQLTAALDQGYWYARSAELMQKPIIQLLVWMRVPGDTIFSVGALALAWFVLRLVGEAVEVPCSWPLLREVALFYINSHGLGREFVHPGSLVHHLVHRQYEPTDDSNAVKELERESQSRFPLQTCFYGVPWASTELRIWTEIPQGA